MINLLAQVEPFHGFSIATTVGGRTAMKNIHNSTIGKLLLRANLIQRSELDAAHLNCFSRYETPKSVATAFLKTLL